MLTIMINYDVWWADDRIVWQKIDPLFILLWQTRTCKKRVSISMTLIDELFLHLLIILSRKYNVYIIKDNSFEKDQAV